jgi:flavin-dependent dehydrogenase
MRKIRILGAGISGLAAAINLAKKGYDVQVYERNPDVGRRFNGDVQGLESWSDKKDVIEQLEDMNISINFHCEPFSKVIVDDCKRTGIAKSEKPFFYLVKRGAFKGTIDYGLKEQAIANGVKIKFNSTIPEKDADIVATGPTISSVFAIDKGIVFNTSHKDIATWVLSDDLAYKWYAYLLVTKGWGCLCTVTETAKIKECFEKTKEYVAKKYGLKIKKPKLAGGTTSFNLRHKLHEGKTLYVGEAAGLQDLLWGFGMKYGLVSGYLAAKSISEGVDYDKLIHAEFADKLKASIVNRFIWEKFNTRLYSSLARHARFGAQMLYPMHNFSLAQRIIYPFAKAYLRKKYPGAGI